MEPIRPLNGASDKHGNAPRRPDHPLTPTAANGDRHISERGRDAAVRFILDPMQAESETRQVKEYFKVEIEEYEADE